MDKPKTKLKKLRIDRVDLVDRGANPDAQISFFKRDVNDPLPDVGVMPDAPYVNREKVYEEIKRRAQEAHPGMQIDRAVTIYLTNHPEAYKAYRLANIEDPLAKAEHLSHEQLDAARAVARRVARREGVEFEDAWHRTVAAALDEVDERLAKLHDEIEDAGRIDARTHRALADSAQGEIARLAKRREVETGATTAQAYADALDSPSGRAAYARYVAHTNAANALIADGDRSTNLKAQIEKRVSANDAVTREAVAAFPSEPEAVAVAKYLGTEAGRAAYARYLRSK